MNMKTSINFCLFVNLFNLVSLKAFHIWFQIKQNFILVLITNKKIGNTFHIFFSSFILYVCIDFFTTFFIYSSFYYIYYISLFCLSHKNTHAKHPLLIYFFLVIIIFNTIKLNSILI